MSDNSQDSSAHIKMVAMNTIGIWVLILLLGGWIFFKSDDSLTNDTLAKLSTSVDKLSESAENFNKIAIGQREWLNNVNGIISKLEDKRNNEYGGLYEKYGINDKDSTINIDQLYDLQLQLQPNDQRSGHVYRNENTASENGVVQTASDIDKVGPTQATGKPKS